MEQRRTGLYNARLGFLFAQRANGLESMKEAAVVSKTIRNGRKLRSNQHTPARRLLSVSILSGGLHTIL